MSQLQVEQEDFTSQINQLNELNATLNNDLQYVKQQLDENLKRVNGMRQVLCYIVDIRIGIVKFQLSARYRISDARLFSVKAKKQ